MDGSKIENNPGFRDFVADLIDDQVRDLMQRVADGYVMSKEEALAALGQLLQDRGRMRGLTARQGATVQ